MADKQSTTMTTEFQFVNATIDDPTIPQDLAIRALIRKQAMKKASAARRRDGNYGKHNLRQYPVFLFDQKQAVDIHTGAAADVWVGGGEVEEVREKERPVVRIATKGAPMEPVRVREVRVRNKRKEMPIPTCQTEGRSMAMVVGKESIPPSLSARGYELTSMKSDFDILDLSTLATLHVGRAARGALSRNPYHLISQLRSFKQWSYLSFLPSLYGQIPCLSDATDCVIARARQIISPNRKWEAAVITFYVKALDSLQKALDAPSQRFRPEVLCATEILSLYELLDPAGETAWIRHAAGAARLIQLRGPRNYNTEFEKALFMAHTGPIMTEALLNNERCFLEQAAWKAVFRSIIREDALLSDRSSIVISLMILKSNIPGLFVDVTNIMYSPLPSPSTITSITTTLTHLRTDLYHWHAEYNTLLAANQAIYPGTAEYDRHCKVYATYLSCLIIVSRLLGALSASERRELEEETQRLARSMLDMECAVKGASSAAGMFMAQTLGVSQATIASSADWLNGSSVYPHTRTNSLPGSEESTSVRRSSSISVKTNYLGGEDIWRGNDRRDGSEGETKLESISPEGFLASRPPSSGLGEEEALSEGFSSSSGIGGEVSTAPSSDCGFGNESVGGRGGLIERWKFEGWCARFGRVMPVFKG